MLTPAILICSMMMLPVNANALWFDIVKEFVTGGIKMITMPKSVTNPAPAPTPAAKTPTPEAPKATADPTPQDIFEALGRLESVCRQLANNIPCSMGIGKAQDQGMALNKARANARIELASTMGTYVKSNVKKDGSSDEVDGIFKEVLNYMEKGELNTEQFVVGSQQYMSYTYIDEAATEIQPNKRSVYVTTVVMVMNPELFGKAIEEVSKDKPLSQQIINESKKGIVAVLKTAIKKI